LLIGVLDCLMSAIICVFVQPDEIDLLWILSLEWSGDGWITVLSNIAVHWIWELLWVRGWHGGDLRQRPCIWWSPLESTTVTGCCT
jgi:hypothetical protein